MSREPKGRLVRGAVAVVIAAASMLVSAPAVAAEGDAERGFPVLEGDWYDTALGYPYDSTAHPSPHVDESLIREGVKVSYYTPGGSGPSHAQGDLSINAFPMSEEASSTVVEIDFARFDSLLSDLGTTFTDAIVLPAKEKCQALNGTQNPQPEVNLVGSVLSITRPAISCDSLHQYRYEFQIALLGSNGYKYLTDVDVAFGKQIEKPQEEVKTEPIEEPAESEEEPATEESAPPAPDEKPSTPAKPEVASPSTDADPATLTALIVGAGIVLAIVAVVIRRRWPKPGYLKGGALAESAKRFKGNRATKADSDEEEDN